MFRSVLGWGPPPQTPTPVILPTVPATPTHEPEEGFRVRILRI